MSGKTSRAKYSWDTNLFIAHLKKEAGKPLADMAAVLNEVELGRADFVVSTIVIAEMLDVIEDPVLASEFQGFIRRPNVLVVNVDPRIARRTAQIRAEWRASTPPGQDARNIKTPDAIIIATAMLAEVTVLHSLEPKFHRHNRTDLVGKLEITMPVLADGQKVIPEAFITEPSTEPPNEEGKQVEEPSKQGDSISSTTDAGTGTGKSAQHSPAAESDKGSTEEIVNVPKVSGPAELVHASAVIEPKPKADLAFGGEIAATAKPQSVGSPTSIRKRKITADHGLKPKQKGQTRPKKGGPKRPPSEK